MLQLHFLLRALEVGSTDPNTGHDTDTLTLVVICEMTELNVIACVYVGNGQMLDARHTFDQKSQCCKALYT